MIGGGVLAHADYSFRTGLSPDRVGAVPVHGRNIPSGIVSYRVADSQYFANISTFSSTLRLASLNALPTWRLHALLPIRRTHRHRLSCLTATSPASR
jgi:hypothetical protein